MTGDMVMVDMALANTAVVDIVTNPVDTANPATGDMALTALVDTENPAMVDMASTTLVVMSNPATSSPAPVDMAAIMDTIVIMILDMDTLAPTVTTEDIRIHMDVETILVKILLIVHHTKKIFLCDLSILINYI